MSVNRTPKTPTRTIQTKSGANIPPIGESNAGTPRGAGTNANNTNATIANASNANAPGLFRASSFSSPSSSKSKPVHFSPSPAVKLGNNPEGPFLIGHGFITLKELKEAGVQMRQDIEIQNRMVQKKLFKNCFVGYEAVSWMASRGIVARRTEAVEVGKVMIELGMVGPAEENVAFKDEFVFYRFAEDRDQVAGLAASNAGWGTEQPKTCNGNGSEKSNGFFPNGSGVSPALLAVDGYNGERSSGGGLGPVSNWDFAPHTAHNSLVLNWKLACQLTHAFSNGADELEKTRGLLLLRDKVRQVSKNHASGWTLSRNLKTSKGYNVEEYTRRKPAGEFETTKVVGRVPITPQRFLRDFYTFQGRKRWEGALQYLKVVENLPVEDCENPYLMPSASSGSFLLSLNDEEGKEEETVGRREDEDEEEEDCVYGEGKIFYPPGMSVALLNDASLIKAIEQVKEQTLASNPEACLKCDEYFTKEKRPTVCHFCGSVCCYRCCCKHVYEVSERRVVRLCKHCFKVSSRIRHAPPSATFRKNSKGNVGVGNKIVKQAHKRAELELDHDSLDKWWRNLDYFRDYHNAGSSCDPVLHVQDSFRSSTDSISSQKSSSSSCGGGGDSVVGGGREKQTEKDKKRFAKCKSCGLEVVRTIENIEKHAEECSGASSLSINLRVTEDEAGIIPCSTRIIYRSAKVSSSVARPREVCVFQDTFCDDDGTVYIYEVSVRHNKVHGISGHVTAEALFFAYVIRPHIRYKGISSLTIISQMDTKSSMPVWLGTLLGDNGRYGLFGNLDTDLPVSDVTLKDSGSSGEEEDLEHTSNATSDLNSLSTAPGVTQSVGITDFKQLSVIGQGGFGKVLQVKHRETGEVYAMKVLLKEEIKKRHQIERTRTERQVLEKITHPFIVKLVYAFQDSLKVYMCLEFAQGGDFFTYMRRVGRMQESWVRLYVAEISLALQYLHDNDIVYRDLKPENILLNGDGHIKLTDFGLCRYFEVRTHSRNSRDSRHISQEKLVTHSFCGTEEYMAPEVLLNQGHGVGADWWCLGLCMHEMLARSHPFKGATRRNTLRNMCIGKPNIDSSLSRNAQSLLRGLLRNNSREHIRESPEVLAKQHSMNSASQKYRLCCGPTGIQELKDHPFFQELDWRKVYDKGYDPPYVPATTSPEDTRHFASYYTSEVIKDNGFAAKEKGSFSVFPFSKSKSNRGDTNNDGTPSKSQNLKPTEAEVLKVLQKKETGDEDEFSGFSYVDPEYLGGGIQE